MASVNVTKRGTNGSTDSRELLLRGRGSGTRSLASGQRRKHWKREQRHSLNTTMRESILSQQAYLSLTTWTTGLIMK